MHRSRSADSRSSLFDAGDSVTVGRRRYGERSRITEIGAHHMTVVPDQTAALATTNLDATASRFPSWEGIAAPPQKWDVLVGHR